MKKKKAKANDQPGLASVAVRMKLTLCLGPHPWADEDGVSSAGSLTFTAVAPAIRKTLREPELCLTYSNASSSEQALQMEIRKINGISCQDVTPLSLLPGASQGRGMKDAIRQTLSPQ